MNCSPTLNVLTLMCLATLSITPLAAQRVLFVGTNTAGGGTGAGWGDAFTDLQPALAAAVSGDEIWVRTGTYRAGPAGSRAATFALKNGVRVYGGFVGSETSREQRDPAVHETILSGDLSRNDQTNFVNYAENSYHVVTGSATDPTAVLDGFVIQGGNASGSTTANNSGGGMKIDHGSPTIANCVFRANAGRLAAGLLIIAGHPLLTRCVFSNNVAQSTFARGGALYHASGSSPQIVDCAFLANRASGGVNAIDGGAVFLDATSSGEFLRCRFADNRSATAEPNAGTGGAVSSLAGGVTFRQCAFWNNSSGAGGAAWNGGGNFLFVNCAFAGNVAQSGGAMLNFASTGTLAGCTMAGNFARDGGGVFNDLNSLTRLQNSILWMNVATNAMTAFRAQIHNLNGGTHAASFTCVQDLFVPQPGEPPPTLELYPGCTDRDPLLADVGRQQLHLRLGSPCIDAADGAAMPPGATGDLERHERFLDEPLTADTGPGPPPVVDMGAYEYQGVIPEQIRGPFAGRETVGGVERFVLTYLRDRKLTGVRVTAEASAEIAPPQWLPSGLEFNQAGEDPLNKTFKATTPIMAGSNLFFRLMITLQ